MTRKESLELCKELWTWLAENPKLQKSDWPRFQLEDLGDFLHLCPACEYTWWAAEELHGVNNFTMEQSCQLCPLLVYWVPNTIGDTPARGRCEDPFSPYEKWKFYAMRMCGDSIDIAACTKYAQEIASYCDCELAKLLQEESNA
jgi:hypothetical protein